MDYSFKNIIVILLSISAVAILITAIVLPFLLHLRKVVRDQALNASDSASKIQAALIYLDIFIYSVLVFVKDPNRYFEAVLTWLGWSLIWSIFLVIVIIQIRLFRGERVFGRKRKH